MTPTTCSYWIRKGFSFSDCLDTIKKIRGWSALNISWEKDETGRVSLLVLQGSCQLVKEVGNKLTSSLMVFQELETVGKK